MVRINGIPLYPNFYGIKIDVYFVVLYCTVQLKFNFTLARKDTRAFASFLRGITEYFSSI